MTVQKFIKRANANSDPFSSASYASGNYVMYVAAQDGIARLFASTWLKEYNGYQRDYIRAGAGDEARSVLPRPERHRLRGELAIVFGPKMSATDVIVALEKVIDSIKREGLIVGRTKTSDWLLETVSGETKPKPKPSV